MPAPEALPVSFDAIEAAAARLVGRAVRTPVVRSPRLDQRTGARVHLKCENLQRAGAFKFRGAYNAVSQLDAGARARGVVSYSSGNHAQGLALAAGLLGVRATIVMPADAPAVKLRATRELGAEVVLYERLEEKREVIARRLAEERGLTVIPPFDHPWIIAGQGTATLELLAEEPELDVLVVPIGGGGLIAGAAIAAKALRPNIRVYGVEPEVANDTYLSLQRGERVSTAQARSIADGLLPTAPGRLTFPVMQRHLEGVVLVTEAELEAATLQLLIEQKLLTEPSGAAGVAAVVSGKVPDIAGRAVGVILSGGNVDPGWLGERLSAR